MGEKIEHQKFLELCEYVHTEILEYSKDIKFPKHLALRLRGLQKGQFIAKNNAKPLANYDYEAILLTFKMCKFDILSKIRQKDNFKDEKHRINYMMVIIEDKINDVVLKIEKNKKAKRKSELIEIYDDKGAEYKTKTKKIKSSIIDNLW
ncbi:hypothetical protein [Clostridium botulinum]|uniref:hypothetical protein n=1 Tax=Clostridium botulinum TaxID=1491 RepID=UPI001E580B46|nr:hypothetical protein [Clostridium botulinum]MCD3275578.1 hypothetical protein [Clostridium botulinum C/D]MCD3286502.1 hypothetical protein [Clostridium botulinum C/D]MCD3291471.1 hypothetical protein [Clostridium botulinum C/D]MCD3303821.1 hypothetical protein [Clostridium botulinum C/D]